MPNGVTNIDQLCTHWQAALPPCTHWQAALPPCTHCQQPLAAAMVKYDKRQLIMILILCAIVL